MLSSSATEYLLTMGILLAFFGIVVGVIFDRKNILRVLKEHGLTKRKILVAVGILFVFAFLELYYVKPTQLLFFDDAIYQGMAQQMLNSGQAWMCDYGTPHTCFSGEVFHEPIGLSFNMAIGFAIFGVGRWVEYAAGFVLACFAVFLIFFVSLLLLKNLKGAYFAELLLALSPILLVWAMPTNSDLPRLTYSLLALFFVLIFINRKTKFAMSNMLLSLSLLMFMKVDSALLFVVLLILYMLLDDSSLIKSIKKNAVLIKRNVLNTSVLFILLIFVVSLAPSISYSYAQLTTGNYGAQGTIIQDTCDPHLRPINVTGSINMVNFNANVCGNIGFWFNQYAPIYIMQPAFFTALAILGAILMLFSKRKELLAIGIWFIAFFLLYTAFYAGAVIYGVDWRFMLSLIAQACIFGGFAIGFILDKVELFLKSEKGHSALKRNRSIINGIGAVVVVVLLFYPIYKLIPQLAINPSNIQQAGDARFYEAFVYQKANLIPQGCLVYSYDPFLYQLNGRAAIQMSELFNSSKYTLLLGRYSCLVLDYGYWCHTPNNLCIYATKDFNLTPIATATYQPNSYNYGFYYVNKK